MVSLRPRNNGRAVVGSAANNPIDLTNDSDDAEAAPAPVKRRRPTLRPAKLSRTPIRKKPQTKAKPKAKPKPKPTPKVKQQMCNFCAEQFNVTDFPAEQMSHGCNIYVRGTCRPCLHQFIASQISILGGGIGLPCPWCGLAMPLEDIKLLADEATFARYEKQVARAEAAKIPDHHFCQVPGCDAGQIHPNPEEPFTCDTCKSVSCVNCGGAWHDGKTCQEHQSDIKKRNKIKVNDTASSFKKLHVKICPGVATGSKVPCLTKVQKESGCDHMQCSKCQTEFCWSCLAMRDMTKGIQHDTKCPNYQPNVPNPHYAGGAHAHARRRR